MYLHVLWLQSDPALQGSGQPGLLALTSSQVTLKGGRTDSQEYSTWAGSGAGLSLKDLLSPWATRTCLFCRTLSWAAGTALGGVCLKGVL